jgi:hypothetical protein
MWIMKYLALIGWAEGSALVGVKVGMRREGEMLGVVNHTMRRDAFRCRDRQQVIHLVTNLLV